MQKLNDALHVMMLPLVVVGIKAVCRSVREATASGVDNAASGWQTPLNRIISPSEG